MLMLVFGPDWGRSMDAMCLVDIGVYFLARYIVPLELPASK